MLLYILLFGAMLLVDLLEAQKGVPEGAGQIHSGGATAAHREGTFGINFWCMER